MPKMTHPNQIRPLSVQEADVARYEGMGWTLVAETEAEPTAKPEPKTAKKAVTRKSSK